jgi:glycosyltransferase involved in cell wall biosynthesis
MSLVTAVIPTHNRVGQLLRTLESLRQTQGSGAETLEVVVVANACTDNTVQALAQEQPRSPFRLLTVDEPIANLNRARNRGVAAARGELVALLDDDVWVERGWLEGVVEGFSRHPASLLAGRVELWWDAVDRPHWMSASTCKLLSCTDLGAAPLELDTSQSIVGANLAFRRAVWEAIGGFVEGLDRSGTELLSGGDTEFVYRALRAGHRLFYCPSMAVRHWVAPHRVSLAYLEKVARGRGQTAVHLALLGNQDRLPSLVMRGCAMWLRGALAGVRGLASGDSRRRVDARLYRLRGRGMAEAAWTGLLRRIPKSREREATS